MKDLTPEQVAWARKVVREELANGTPVAEVETFLRKSLGVGIAEAVKPQESDFWRGVAQAVTLGHGDELAGLFAKMQGGDYKHARDDARTQQSEFEKLHPGKALAVDAVGGSLPMSLAGPAIGAVAGTAGATLARIAPLLKLLSPNPLTKLEGAAALAAARRAAPAVAKGAPSLLQPAGDAERIAGVTHRFAQAPSLWDRIGSSISALVPTSLGGHTLLDSDR